MGSSPWEAPVSRHHLGNGGPAPTWGRSPRGGRDDPAPLLESCQPRPFPGLLLWPGVGARISRRTSSRARTASRRLAGPRRGFRAETCLTTLRIPLTTPVVAVPTFAELGLSEKVIDALGRVEITTPTPVQAAVIPDAMAGHDVLGRAQTGSGKTLAFGLPILARLAGERSRPKHPRALIIVPTRELATQVAPPLEPLASPCSLSSPPSTAARRTTSRSSSCAPAPTSSSRRPGRLQDLIDKGHCRSDDVEMTVLDEADHLCDLGFYPAVDALLEPTPERRPADAALRHPRRRRRPAGPRAPARPGAARARPERRLGRHDGPTTCWPSAASATRSTAAVALVEANPRTIVFTRTREGATELAEALGDAGIDAVDLHGNLSQRVRERNLHASPPARRRPSSPPTSPPAASTSTTSAWSCTSTRPPTPRPTCTAPAVRRAPASPAPSSR